MADNGTPDQIVNLLKWRIEKLESKAAFCIGRREFDERMEEVNYRMRVLDVNNSEIRKSVDGLRNWIVTAAIAIIAAIVGSGFLHNVPLGGK